MALKVQWQKIEIEFKITLPRVPILESNKKSINRFLMLPNEWSELMEVAKKKTTYWADDSMGWKLIDEIFGEKIEHHTDNPPL